ncbi:tRNA-uridine aminocarboxypropyltransferase [Photobacterium alginatilyticum]|uniref:tRNA-uridine aminocarboxypropyltransferase n=1 Tax=Photobacterium alginatilyticum TaxID=1775171 RepID=A0ABW9YIS7_9GAMM|nr:DTW domain-containing protein [Photobacterium alginatilyticum]NBI53655.1 DTW domain-containing protein [Photobacterium alginatilyticum]
MSCSRCGFQHNCICHAEPRLNSKARFILLTHPKELGKDTNTGELMLRTLPDSQRYTWDRVNPPAALLDELRAPGNQPWLLFPSDEEHPAAKYQREAGKQPLFILLDATWQEARKMVRKSPWLAQLPRLSLSPSSASAYQLRRNQQTGNLCTCEAGIALLELLGEVDQATQLNEYFQAFIDTFHADKSGHAKHT